MIGAIRLGSSSLNRIRRVGHADHARGLHELALAQREHLAAHEAGQCHPGEQGEHQQESGELPEDQPTGLRPEADHDDRGDGESDEDERQRQEHVDDEVDDPVDPAAAEAGDQADDDADEGGHDGGDGGHEQRGARAVEPLREVVVRGVRGDAERGLPGEAVVRRPVGGEVELVQVRDRVARVQLDAEQLGEPRGEHRDQDEHDHDREAARSRSCRPAAGPSRSGSGTVRQPSWRRVRGHPRARRIL